MGDFSPRISLFFPQESFFTVFPQDRPVFPPEMVHLGEKQVDPGGKVGHGECLAMSYHVSPCPTCPTMSYMSYHVLPCPTIYWVKNSPATFFAPESPFFSPRIALFFPQESFFTVFPQDRPVFPPDEPFLGEKQP